MKKSPILLTIIILFTLNVFAQEQKGKFFIGGLSGISLNNNNTTGDTDYRESTTKTWSVAVPFGYFVSNAFLIGIIPGMERLGYTSEYQNSYGFSNSERKNHQFTIGPFVREYIVISEKVNFFLDWNALVGFGKESYTSTTIPNYSGEINITETQGKVLSFSTGISPGISIQLSKWLFMDASIGRLGYDYMKYKPDQKSNIDEERTNDSFAFSFNTFKFGLSAKLGK